MKSIMLLVCALAVVVSLPAQAVVVWSDNFDSYPVGPLIGNGGWEGWDLNSAFDGRVTNAISRSPENSAEILPTTDVVQSFTGLNSGMYIVSGWVYFPDNFVGEQYFIMLNTYAPGGTNNWSLQVLFDGSAGIVENQGEVPATLPLVRGQWVEMRVEIDLTMDLQMIFYDGQMLASQSWTNGQSGGGDLNIDTIDLFSNGGSSIFWDDFMIEEVVATPVEEKTWGGVKDMFR